MTIKTFRASKNKFRKAHDGLRHRVATIEVLDPKTGEPYPSKTIQSQKDASDINNIVKKYRPGELLAESEAAIKQYGDFTIINEFDEAQNVVAKAKQSFDQLPATIREKFNNNPGEFFEFATNPANNEELVKLGLATKIEKIAETITKVEITNPTRKPETDAKKAETS